MSGAITAPEAIRLPLADKPLATAPQPGVGNYNIFFIIDITRSIAAINLLTGNHLYIVL